MYLILGFSLSFPSMLNNNFLDLIPKQRVFVHLRFSEQQQLFKELQKLNKYGFILLRANFSNRQTPGGRR